MRLLVLLFSLLLGSLAAAEEIYLTNGEWPPYTGEKLPHYGVASRIVTEAFAIEGVKVHWEFYPWARAMRLAKSGQRPGTAAWLNSPEREQAFFISDPLIMSGYVLFHRKDDPFNWQTIDDLRDLRIGAVIGYDYGVPFEQAERDKRLQVKRVNTDEQAFRLLLAGRIDILPVDRLVGLALLQHFDRADRERLTYHRLPLRKDNLHLLLSRQIEGNEELMERFNRGLAELERSGKLERYRLEAQQLPGSVP